MIASRNVVVLFRTSLAVAIGSLAISCASARSVTMQPGAGGVVAISPQDSEKARAKADALMSRTCRGKGHQVVEEGETVVGSKTKSESSSGPGSGFVSRQTSGTSESRDLTEWRLKYVCKK